MSTDKYFHKYMKYKKKYNDLKKTTNKYPFYLIHQTDSDNFKKILKSGLIKKGSDIAPEYRHGAKALNYVFTSINFEDLNNISNFSSNAFIINPNILNDFDAGFNIGWFQGPTTETVYFNKDDSINERNQKMKLIRDQLKKVMNDQDKGKSMRVLDGWMDNEVIFSNEIDLNKYLIGVVCLDCDSNTKNIITDRYDVPIIEQNNL